MADLLNKEGIKFDPSIDLGNPPNPIFYAMNNFISATRPSHKRNIFVNINIHLAKSTKSAGKPPRLDMGRFPMKSFFKWKISKFLSLKDFEAKIHTLLKKFDKKNNSRTGFQILSIKIRPDFILGSTDRRKRLPPLNYTRSEFKNLNQYWRIYLQWLAGLEDSQTYHGKKIPSIAVTVERIADNIVLNPHDSSASSKPSYSTDTHPKEINIQQGAASYIRNSYSITSSNFAGTSNFVTPQRPHNPKKQIPKTQARKRQAPKTKVPQRQVPEIQVPQRQVPEIQVPQRQNPETQVPQRQNPETQVPQRQNPETQVPQRHVPETQVPRRHVPETQFPQRQVPPGRRLESPPHIKGSQADMIPAHLDHFHAVESAKLERMRVQFENARCFDESDDQEFIPNILW